MDKITGLIFNIQKFSLNDGPGIRTTVFLKGCPLSCVWCHNPESRNPYPEKFPISQYKTYYSSSNGLIGYETTVTSIVDEIRKDSMFYEESGGGVTFSGGEPLMQPDFLRELLKSVKSYDIHTAIDTCGYAAFEQFEKIIPFTDLFLFDLKIMDDGLHRKFAGVSNKLIHSNLLMLDNLGVKIYIRIPLIPGITDTDENLNAAASFITRLKSVQQVTLLPYNEIGAGKYKKMELDYELDKFKTQSPERLNYFSDIFIQRGFEVKIRG